MASILSNRALLRMVVDMGRVDVSLLAVVTCWTLYAGRSRVGLILEGIRSSRTYDIAKLVWWTVERNSIVLWFASNDFGLRAPEACWTEF